MKSPRQRVEQALRGDHSDRVPFTIYETMIPQSSAEREMRRRGLCIVKRDVPVYVTHMPNVRVTERIYWDGPRRMTRTQFETPVGTVSTLTEAAGFTQWFHEKMFKSLDDYATIRFLIEDEVYEPNYEAFARAQAVFGDDAIFRAQIGDIGFGPSPVHLKSDAEVEQTTVDLLNELPSVDGVIMGVTENMPPERWPDSCLAIMDGLDRHARQKNGGLLL